MPDPIDELIPSILEREPHLSREEAARRAAQILRSNQDYNHPNYFGEPPVNYHEDVARDQILPSMRENVHNLRNYAQQSRHQDDIAQQQIRQARAENEERASLGRRYLDEGGRLADHRLLPAGTPPPQTISEQARADNQVSQSMIARRAAALMAAKRRQARVKAAFIQSRLRNTQP